MSKVSSIAVASLLTFAVAGCNDQKLTSGAAATPVDTTPAPTPTAPPTNQPPVAEIQGASTWAPLATASFDGTTSFDPDGTVTTWAWAITQRPAGSVSTVTPNAANSALSTFFVDLAGDYKLLLTVTDNDGATGTRELAFSAVPSDAVHVELTWASQYTHADMDLHLINKSQNATYGNLWDSTYDCDYLNCSTTFGQSLNWWAAGTPDNARLDIDNIQSSVPENINIDQPHDGVYAVNVHYYSSYGGPGINVPTTVNVYLSGALAWTGTVTINQINKVWNVGTITVSGGNATFAAITPAQFFMTTGGY